MRYYNIIIQVDFKTPRQMPPLQNSDESWNSVGYFQTFHCTEHSNEKAKKLVHQYYLDNEENPSDCQFRYERVAWMRFLSKLEDLTFGYDSDLTKEMFENRDKIGIWYSGKKEYYVSEEDAMSSMYMEESDNLDEYDEEYDDDEIWPDYDGQCYACDNYGSVDDMSLCNECAPKLERDLIRQRDWDYSASAFGLTNELREKLRNEIMKEYGKELELIAPSKKKGKKKRNKSKRKNKK